MTTNWRWHPLPYALLIAAGGCQPPREQREQPDATASATVEATASPSAELTCTDPVRPTDTAATLQERYGNAARAETLYGPEGIEATGLVLWPDEPGRRLEVAFMEDGQRTVSSVGLGQGSAWRVAGLAPGDPLARVNAANGRPFKLWGFEWDYGGYASDLANGRLAALPGGCRVIVRLAPRGNSELPDGLSGEVELSSDDARLEAAGVTIQDLSLAF